jgi:hypothetical protein
LGVFFGYESEMVWPNFNLVIVLQEGTLDKFLIHLRTIQTSKVGQEISFLGFFNSGVIARNSRTLKDDIIVLVSPYRGFVFKEGEIDDLGVFGYEADAGHAVYASISFSER